MTLTEKHDALKKTLRDLGRVVVAYSGGVDSTFLLKVAADTLGARNVLACIGVSASLAQSQHDRAIKSAMLIGTDLLEAPVDELDHAKYTANEADRCYHCKSHLYTILLKIAKQKGFNHVICGSNYDDMDDFRPGNRAAKVFGVGTPLMDAGLTKEDIRELSRQMGLPTAQMPASPCLASRVSYGLQITEERLAQVEQAEDFLRGLGFVEFRVRHHGDIARIEVRAEDMAKVTAEPIRSKLVDKLKQLGYKFVTVDLQGFRSGSLNEQLTEEEKSSGQPAS